MKLDHIHEIEQIKQFASQLEFIPKEVIRNFENSFDDDKKIDFYIGLLTGYTNAYSILNADKFEKKHLTDKLGAIIAFLSKKIEGKVL